jgi:hypothetical protein
VRIRPQARVSSGVSPSAVRHPSLHETANKTHTFGSAQIDPYV